MIKKAKLAAKSRDFSIEYVVQADKDLILIAVQHRGECLHGAPEELLADKEIVLGCSTQ